MEKLQIEKPIYPLLSLVAATAIFIIGLLIAKEITIIYFLLGLCLMFIGFGYGKVLLKVSPVFLLIGTILGIGAMISNGSKMVGLQTFGRIMVLAFSSVLMIGLPPINLTRNLVQLKVPRIITLGMLATIRFVPILMEETKQIMEAMKTRGVSMKWYNLSMIYRAFLIPFLMRIISMSDTMAVSMETRGFVLNEKSSTVYKRVEFKIKDILFIAVISILTIGVMNI